MNKIEILLNGIHPQVLIDGKPVERLTKFQFEAEVGSVPIIRMEQWAVGDDKPKCDHYDVTAWSLANGTTTKCLLCGRIKSNEIKVDTETIKKSSELHDGVTSLSQIIKIGEGYR